MWCHLHTLYGQINGFILRQDRNELATHKPSPRAIPSVTKAKFYSQKYGAKIKLTSRNLMYLLHISFTRWWATFLCNSILNDKNETYATMQKIFNDMYSIC